MRLVFSKKDSLSSFYIIRDSQSRIEILIKIAQRMINILNAAEQIGAITI